MRCFTTTCDWKISMLGWMFTLFFVFLGSSAAIWGGWLEQAGPAQGGCCVGFLLVWRVGDFAIGVITHQIWMLWLAQA